MKKLLIFILLALVTALSTFAQPFTNYPATFPSLGYSTAAWGDYDRDGDLDLALAGMTGSSVSVARIFRNDNGLFTDINAGLPGVMSPSTAWADYDGDDDLDLLLAGSNDVAQPTTILFRNDNGIFTDAGAGLPGVADGVAAWGDFDKDGDPDVLLAGSMLARIYRNDGNGAFMDIGQHFPGVINASASWCDFDNDGWPDVLIGGDSGGGPITQLYRNDHGVFILFNSDFSGLSDGMARWADLNNDGREDLVAGGVDKNGVGQFLIYQNLGNGQFTEISTYTMNAMSLAVDFSDYDNDGFQDMIVIGRIQGCGPTALTMLYHNEGFMVFTDVSTLITGVKYGNAVFGDANGDGFADLLFTGLNAYETPVTSLYLNASGTAAFAPNDCPAPPQGLTAAVNGQQVVLGWNTSSDPESSGTGLTYNVFVGTSPVLADVVSPLASPQNGFRRIATGGNAYSDTSWSIGNLQPGNYYWSVQAIDNGFASSGFSPVQSFTILETGEEEITRDMPRLCPNPVSSSLNICSTGSIKGLPFSIVDVNRKVFRSGRLEGPTLEVNSLPAGIYFLCIGKAEPLQFIKTE